MKKILYPQAALLCLAVVVAISGCVAETEQAPAETAEETQASPTPPIGPTPVEPEVVRTATIRIESGPLRVRNAPSLKGSTVVTAVENNATFDVLAVRRDGTWVKIALPDFPQGGWVSADFVELGSRTVEPE